MQGTQCTHWSCHPAQLHHCRPLLLWQGHGTWAVWAHPAQRMATWFPLQHQTCANMCVASMTRECTDTTTQSSYLEHLWLESAQTSCRSSGADPAPEEAAPVCQCEPSESWRRSLRSGRTGSPFAGAGALHRVLLWGRAPALPDEGSCRFHRHQHQALGIPGVLIFNWS